MILYLRPHYQSRKPGIRIEGIALTQRFWNHWKLQRFVRHPRLALKSKYPSLDPELFCNETSQSSEPFQLHISLGKNRDLQFLRRKKTWFSLAVVPERFTKADKDGVNNHDTLPGTFQMCCMVSCETYVHWRCMWSLRIVVKRRPKASAQPDRVTAYRGKPKTPKDARKMPRKKHFLPNQVLSSNPHAACHRDPSRPYKARRVIYKTCTLCRSKDTRGHTSKQIALLGSNFV